MNDIRIKKRLILSLLCFIGTFYLPNAFAHHHKHNDTTAITSPNPSENPLSPKQEPEDVTPFARQATQAVLQNQFNQSNSPVKIDKHHPTTKLFDHYTQRSNQLDAKRGWVNSKHRRGKYDIGINLPLPETADPTSNRARGVFRRATPLYEPDY